MFKLRAVLLAATMTAGLATSAWAGEGGILTSPRVPPDPTPDQVQQNFPDLANPLNKPITGASDDPVVVGTEPPPSLEALQATRPGDAKGDGLEPGRADMVRDRRADLWSPRRLGGAELRAERDAASVSAQSGRRL